MTEAEHAAVTKIVSSQGGYGKGIYPNPFAREISDWKRRENNIGLIRQITDKIERLIEPRFITPPETAEGIQAIATMIDARRILEVGTCTGFTALHLMRSIVGKANAKVVSIDARPAHDREWFTQPQFLPWFEFVEGWTPEVFSIPSVIAMAPYDLVFLDSDHTIDHTKKEVAALWKITRQGTIFLIHDLPAWQSPTHQYPAPVKTWIEDYRGFNGFVFQTSSQLDCTQTWGEGYPLQCSPGLGVFQRR